MKEKHIKLRLIANVTYQPNGTSIEHLDAQLRLAAKFLFDEGLLSGGSDAAATKLKVSVKQIK